VIYRLTADLIVVCHALFVLFVIFGGLLVWRWKRVLALHLLAVGWGVLVELAGLICPLTPLENHFRELGDQASYRGDFIDHYVTAALYPAGLTRNIQIVLGLAVVLFNVVIYGVLIRRWRRR
jgi:hypothetical protein